MSTREQLLSSIADTIQDYRAGDVNTPTPDHVERWVKQFDEKVQLGILQEMDYVLKRTYFSLERVTEFLSFLTDTEELVGDDPYEFWQNMVFLKIQRGGKSQTDMLDLFDELLKRRCGFGIAECGNDSSTYLYLDDNVFSGKRVFRDLKAWIINQAPAKAKLYIVVMAIHSNGYFQTNKQIKKAVRSAGKKIEIIWWSPIKLENRVASHKNKTDVLRPTYIPKDDAVLEYVAQMSRPPITRRSGNAGVNSLYTNDKGKRLLEQEFLKAGAYIHQTIPDMGITQRPLGHSPLVSLGFGSLIVTYRNCPNNAPLALWIGDPWYPLFPRFTHSDARFQSRRVSWKNEA